MAFDSEEKKSDFESWAESMTYEEEKEIKRQEKLQLKQKKKAEKMARKFGRRPDEVSDTEPSKEEPSGDDASAEKSEPVGYEAYKAILEGTSEKSSTESSESEESKTEEAEGTSEGDNATEGEESSEESGKKKKKKKKKKEDYNPDYIKEKKPEEINIVKELLSLIIYIGVVIILCYCIITFVGQRTTVNGRSMENTLHDGDNLWIDKLSYHFRNPNRFDIIVFPYEDDVYYIKRVIGLPGETVQILPDGTIIIDGKKLVESYGKEIITETGTAAEPRTLGEDEFFVLGDNRNDSRDSRFSDVGNINKEDIIGRAVFRLSPFSKFGKIDK